jgi:hypothetical protein
MSISHTEYVHGYVLRMEMGGHSLKCLLPEQGIRQEEGSRDQPGLRRDQEDSPKDALFQACR